MSELWIPVMTIMISTLSIFLIPDDSNPLAFLRWILGAAFVLFLPGYILAEAFLSSMEKKGSPDRFMLAFAFSMLVVGAMGYLLNQLPWGMNTVTITSGLWLVVFGGILVKIAYEKHGRTTFQLQQSPMSNRGIRVHHYIILLFITMLGMFVRLVPYTKVGGFIDLDPYNHYMKVTAIQKLGRTPSFDSLSLAPQGTSKTYTITPLGFEFLVVALELVTQAPLVELMGLLPTLYGALLILAMFFLCYEATNSTSNGLFGAFLTAFPNWWGLIYSVTMNPLAENVGLFLFLLALVYLGRYVNTCKKSDVLCSGILFGTMFYIHLFTVIYFVLILIGYVVISFLTNIKLRLVLRAVGCTLAVGLSLSLPILLQVLAASISSGYAFSRIALYLAFLSGSYLALVPEDLPHILSFPLQYLIVIALWVTLATISVGIVERVLRKNHERCKNHSLPASWCLSLLLAGFMPSIESLRNVLAMMPFSGPFLFTHRVVPYLTLAFYLLAAIAISDSTLFTRGFNLTFKLKSRIVRLSVLVELAIMVPVIIFVPITSVGYVNELSSWPTPDTYRTFFEWVKENTSNRDIFIVNNWDVAMWLRAVANRPTVFSHVHQDLVSGDAEKRILLHTVVFSGGLSNNETIKLLDDYDISYVVVTSRPVYVDMLNEKWIWGIPDIEEYIINMDSRSYLERVFSEDGKIWVYSFNDNVTVPHLDIVWR